MQIQISKQKSPTIMQALSIEYDTPSKRDVFSRFKNAEYRLNENYIPQNIICRDQEANIVKNFVKSFIKNGYAKESLYISGCPGIGKTLIVNKIFQQFKNSPQIQKAKVKFIHLNAMNLKEPKDIFKSLYLQLANHTSKANKKLRVSPYNAMIKLDTIFRQVQDLEQIDEQIKPMKKLVFIDEIDYLQTKEEDILYNLFDWTQSEESKLAIIAVSNTFDFPDRLKQKIKSRMGNNILCFKPYDDKQLQLIINQRVQQTEVFQKNAIRQNVKRIAQTASDLRKCFQIFRQAIFKYLNSGENITKISCISSATVKKAYDEIYCDFMFSVYSNMPRPYKQVLKEIAKHFQRDIRYIAQDTIFSICKTSYKLSQYDIKSIILNLYELGLVDYKSTGNHLGSKNQRKWMCKLLIESDKIMSALYNFQ